MQQPAARFIAHTEASTGFELLRFIKDEFDVVLDCGILAHGFQRLRCGTWGQGKLLAFSGQRRGSCPGFGARRMWWAEAHLVGHVIPHLPLRQRVPLLQNPLRLLLADQPAPCPPVLQAMQRVVFNRLTIG